MQTKFLINVTSWSHQWHFNEQGILKKTLISEFENIVNTVMMKHKLFQCAKCPHAYANRKLLKRHKEKDHKLGSLKCQHCPGVFTNKVNFDQHQSTHFGQKTYNCQKCPSVFTLKAFLRLHENAHLNMDTINCREPCSNMKVDFKFKHVFWSFTTYAWSGPSIDSLHFLL